LERGKFELEFELVVGVVVVGTSGDRLQRQHWTGAASKEHETGLSPTARTGQLATCKRLVHSTRC